MLNNGNSETEASFKTFEEIHRCIMMSLARLHWILCGNIAFNIGLFF